MNKDENVNVVNELHEVNFKIVREGNLYNAFIFNSTSSEWDRVLPEFTLYSSVIGALESELYYRIKQL